LLPQLDYFSRFFFGSAVALLFRRYFGLTHPPISLLKCKKNQPKMINMWTVPYEQSKNENKLVSFRSRPFDISSVAVLVSWYSFIIVEASIVLGDRGIVSVVCFIVLPKVIKPSRCNLTRAASWPFHIEVHPSVIIFQSFLCLLSQMTYISVLKSSFMTGSKIPAFFSFGWLNGSPDCFV